LDADMKNIAPTGLCGGFMTSLLSIPLKSVAIDH
jgi:hypothetical protein